MKKLLLISLVALFAISTTSVNAQDTGKEKKVIETKATKVESTRGEDPNITADRPTVDEAAPQPDEATRGDWCKVFVDNWTGYDIDIYVDGDYAGTIGSWAKEYTWAIAGETKIYGKSTGGSYSWGPFYFDCLSEYTWKFTP